MKRTLLTFLLACFCSTVLFAENPLFKPGMKLIYKVQTFGSYNFAVRPLQTSPEVKFGWNMSHQQEMYGHITISKEALASATKQMNEFEEGGDLSLTDMTTVVLSSAVFQSLKAGKPTTMNTGSGDKIFTMKETQPYKFKMDGVDAERKVLYIESQDGKEKLWVLDDALPLIVKMSIGFSIILDEVITEKPVDNLLAMVGKNLRYSPETQAVWNRIRKSSWEEATDDRADGGDLVWEYFCPIEGLRVVTTNDTITYLMLYNQGAEQVDFIWDATDANLPYGLKLNMTRQEVEKMLGATEEKTKKRSILSLYCGL